MQRTEQVLKQVCHLFWLVFPLFITEICTWSGKKKKERKIIGCHQSLTIDPPSFTQREPSVWLLMYENEPAQSHSCYIVLSQTFSELQQWEDQDYQEPRWRYPSRKTPRPQSEERGFVCTLTFWKKMLHHPVPWFEKGKKKLFQLFDISDLNKLQLQHGAQKPQEASNNCCHNNLFFSSAPLKKKKSVHVSRIIVARKQRWGQTASYTLGWGRAGAQKASVSPEGRADGPAGWQDVMHSAGSLDSWRTSL